MPQSSLTAWLQKPAVVPQNTKSVTTTSTPEGQAENKKTETLSTSPAKALPHQIEPFVDAVPQAETVSATRTFWTAPTPHLPPNVEIRACTKADISALKRLNGVLLPLPYPDSFYHAIGQDSVTSNLTLLAIWHDDPANVSIDKGRLIGSICCRLLPNISWPAHSGNEGAEKNMLYLSTLALLSPYRGHGIAAHMLHTLIVRAVDAYGITSVGAHVWEANEEGLEWYSKRGFKIVGQEANYYRKLNPSGAAVVQREVKVMDFLGK